MSAPEVLCLGEALIDVVIAGDQTSEHVGGSLLNVAAGVANLDHPASICAWWGKDERGDRLAAWARDAGVTVVPGTDSAERTAVAYAHLDDEGKATYEFALTWDVPEIEEVERYGHLHTGSIAATLEPGGSQVVAVASTVRERATVSYDPNIRPALMESPEVVLERVEQLVALSDVVKASDDDIAWLYPGVPLEDVLRRWVASGPALAVATRGPVGASAVLRGDDEVHTVPQTAIATGDTVGAGDSFMAGLISGLLDAGLLGSPEARARLAEATYADVRPALERALATSGVTVTRNGAYAPTRAELA